MSRAACISLPLRPIPYFATLGNEVVIRIDHQKCSELFVVCHFHHGFFLTIEYRWNPMPLGSTPTSERVASRTSRSAGLSRLYKSTASSRFPGRCRAHYEASAEESGIHLPRSVLQWHVPVPSSRPGLR